MNAAYMLRPEKPCGRSDVADLPGDGGEQPADLSLPPFLGRKQKTEAPGLSWREIDRVANEVEEWAYQHKHESDLNDRLEPEVRRRLAGIVLPEAVEAEIRARSAVPF